MSVKRFLTERSTWKPYLVVSDKSRATSSGLRSSLSQGS